MDKVEAHGLITRHMTEIYKAKNADYGDSFTKLRDEFGKEVILIRLSDKLNRLKTLLKGNRACVDESVEDTLLDLANYAVIELVEIKMENQRAEEAKTKANNSVKSMRVKETQHHDTCEGCKYDDQMIFEHPCEICNEHNKWEME